MARARATRAERFLLGLACAGLAWSLAPPGATAHLGHDVVRAERYLKIEVGEDGLARFVVSLTLGPAAMRTILESADADGDGQVSQLEADAYMRRWGEGLATDLPVTIDGESVPLEWSEPYFTPIGPVRSVDGAVEMVARHELDGGEHLIVMGDGMRLEVLERTDVRLTTVAPVELLAAGPGAAPEDEAQDFYYGNESAAAPDAVALRVRVPGWSRGQRRGAVIGGVLAVLLAGLAWWRLARRRSRG